MKKTQFIAIILVLIVGSGLTVLTLKQAQPAGPSGDEQEHGSEGDEGHGEEGSTGPHGGRLLQEGPFALEVTLFERGVPPQFRIYPFRSGNPVDPQAVDLAIELVRLGGRSETFQFNDQGDYLVSEKVVEEPHSFDVSVTATYGGLQYRWIYESYEGRSELVPEAVERAGISVERAKPREITSLVTAYGRIAPNEDHVAYVIPRFPGTVKEIRKRLGDTVAQDEVLAVIESNESLQTYQVVAPMSGTVLQKDVHAGEFVREGQAIYTVGTMETVWVDLNIYLQDFAKVRLGQEVLISVGEHLPAYKGEITYISPFGAENSQTVLARVVLPNPDGLLRPGLFTSARIIVARNPVPVAVKAGAIQTFRDQPVVFINEDDIFEAQPVELGRADDPWVEVVSGLRAGQAYAAENSFIIKADILKSGASHDH